MTPTIFYASAVVIAACIGFMVIGSAYHWDVRAEGYGRWTRLLGAVALLGIALASVSDRLDEPQVAVGAVVAGGLLAAGFVWAHKALTRRLEDVGPEAPGKDENRTPGSDR